MALCGVWWVGSLGKAVASGSCPGQAARAPGHSKFSTMRYCKKRPPTLRRTAIMATLHLPKVTTLTLRQTAIMTTLRPRKVTNRQKSVLAEGY
jgi:hypothetical protein